MKGTIISLLIFVTLQSYSQTDSIRKFPVDTSISILLPLGKSTVSRAQLDNGFAVRLNDPSAILVSYSVVYSININGQFGLRSVAFKDNEIKLDKEFPLWKDENPQSNFITIERVVCEKNDRKFMVRSLIVPIID